MPTLMDLETDVGKKKTNEAASPPAPAESVPLKVKDSQLTFRLKNKILAYRLGMVCKDRGIAAWEFIEPLIRDDVEIAFAKLQKKLQGMAAEKDAVADKRKAE